MKKFAGLPIDGNTVLFSNFNGKGFGCNPRAIAEKLHALEPGLKLVWVCENEAVAAELPEYLGTVLFESKEYYKTMATAGVWVFNELIQDGTVKREGQFYVQTYHGDRGFKKVGYDAADNAHYRKLTRKRRIIEEGVCDLFTAGSHYAEKFIRSAFAYRGEILLEGTPRDDKLLRADSAAEISRIKEKLGVADSAKIVLYAPTFRDTSGEEGKTGSHIDLPAILEALNAQGCGEWVCLLRAHGGSRLVPDGDVGNAKKFVEVTKYPDMADLLLVSDLLITDYSSSAGDFALTGRPVILYQDDIEKYTQKDRSMYFDMKDSPFWVALDTDEALSILAAATPESARSNDEKILEFYGSTESGRASEAVAARILAFIESRKKL